MALNMDRFHALQKQTEAAGTQITPEQWKKIDGSIGQYSQLYGDMAYYKPSGERTALGHERRAKRSGRTDGRPSAVGGKKVNFLSGVHQDPNTHVPVAPAGQFGNAAETTGTTEQYARHNAFMQDQYNRPNEQTAYGSTEWTIDPITGRSTRKTKLSPWQQRNQEQTWSHDHELGNAQSHNLQNFTNQGQYNLSGGPQAPMNLDYSGLNQFSTRDYRNVAPGMNQADLEKTRTRMEGEQYNKWAARAEPEYKHQQGNIEQQIMDRGLDPTGPQASRMREQLGQQHEDARLQAQAQASAMGGDELSRTYGISSDIRQRGTREVQDVWNMSAAQRQQLASEEQAKFGAGGQSRDRFVNEYGQQYYSPLQNMQAMRGMQSGIVNPNFGAPQNIDYQWVNPAAIGLGYQADATNRYGTDMAYKQAVEVANINKKPKGGGEGFAGAGAGGGFAGIG